MSNTSTTALFVKACEKGDLEAAKSSLRLEPSINVGADNEWEFRNACLYGHLTVAQWLLEIKPTINVSANNECAFRWA